jgi:hypothetical protein
MNPHILMQGPFRRPQWRLDRAVQLISHYPDPLRPGRHDDHYVRVYRQLLLALAAAGRSKAEQEAVSRACPHVYGAHKLHYSSQRESQQILEARLLTHESIDEIALRFGVAPQAIDYYEKLFFDVRDWLDCTGWIRIMAIKGPLSTYGDNNKGEMTLEQRGYLYRLFAYFGGPLVLDAIVNGLGTKTRPQFGDDVGDWFDDALKQIVRSTALAAAHSVQLNERNMMQFIRLAQRKRPARSATRASGPPKDFDKWVEEVWATISQDQAGRALLERAKIQNASSGP